MSQENVEIVRRHYNAYNRQDLAGVLATLDEDIQIDLSATVMPETILEGREQVGAVFTEQWQSSGEVEQRPTEFIDLDDGRVVVPLQCWAKVGGAEQELLMDLADVWTMRDGRGVRIDVYPDKSAALEAVGLPE